MARGDYTRRVRATSRDEVGRAGAGVQPDVGRPGRRRPAPARADRQRLARAAHADHRAAGGAGEHGGRGGRARPDDAADRAGPDRTARPAGHRTARPVAHRRRRAPAGAGRVRGPARSSTRCWPRRRSTRPAPAGMSTSDSSVQPGRRHGRRRPGAAQAGGAEPARQRGPALAGRRPGAAGRAGPTDDALVLEVRDEGPGIAPAERERVFERFTRGERATGGGTGLGLAIARWVVDLHGGTIAVVDGEPGPSTSDARQRLPDAGRAPRPGPTDFHLSSHGPAPTPTSPPVPNRSRSMSATESPVDVGPAAAPARPVARCRRRRPSSIPVRSVHSGRARAGARRPGVLVAVAGDRGGRRGRDAWLGPARRSAGSSPAWSARSR